jgi:hypothetical protein
MFLRIIMVEEIKGGSNALNVVLGRLGQIQGHINPNQVATTSQQTFRSEDVTTHTPAIFNVPPPGSWNFPSPAELKTALSNADAMFAKHLAAPESQQWLENLSKCLEEESALMKPEDKGFELQMRFKAAYGPIHHVASMSLWRGLETGELRAAVLHQESLPPTKEQPIYTGQVFNTFDTSQSFGEQQMLTLCRTLMGDPDLIMIDEPTEGLAPKIVELVADYLQALKNRGISILLVEQKLAIALEISQRVYVMGHGAIVFEGAPADLRANAAIRKEWLEV